MSSRLSDIDKWHKEGWFMSIYQQKQVGRDAPHPIYGFASGVLPLDKVGIRENNQLRTHLGWEIWQDCLYQNGEFRGALIRAEVKTQDGVEFLAVELEYPLAYS